MTQRLILSYECPTLALACFLPAFLNLNKPIYLLPLGSYITSVYLSLLLALRLPYSCVLVPGVLILLLDLLLSDFPSYLFTLLPAPPILSPDLLLAVQLFI